MKSYFGFSLKFAFHAKIISIDRYSIWHENMQFIGSERRFGFVEKRKVAFVWELLL